MADYFQEGQWRPMDNTLVLHNPIVGYASHRIVLDKNKQPVDYEFIEINTTFEKITGLKAGSIVGKKVSAVIPGIDKSNIDWIALYSDIAVHGGEKEFEYYSELLKKWYRVHVFSTGNLLFTTIFVDITSSKTQTEELETFLSLNLDLLCIVNLNGNIIKTNEAWSLILGYSAEDLKNRNFLDFVHPDDIEATETSMSVNVTEECVQKFTNRYKCKDDTFRVLEWRSHPKDNLMYIAARDVTEKIEQERRINDTNRMFESILDGIPQHVFWKDRNSVYLGCNTRGAKVAGVANPAAIIGKTDYDLAWKKKEADFFRECDQRVMANNTPELHIIEPQLQANGKNAWLDTSKIPLHDENGSVVGILVAFEDITTKRAEDEEKLRQAGLIKSLLASIPDNVLIDTLKTPYKDANGSILGILGISRDITERKKAEEDLRSLKERFELVISATNDGTWDWNLITNELFLSARWKEILGYEDNEIKNEFNSFMSLLFTRRYITGNRLCSEILKRRN